MSPIHAIARRARRPLLVLATVLAGAVLLAAGSALLRGRLAETLANRKLVLSTLQSELAQRQLDLNNIQLHIEQFRALKQRGLVGEADREGWVEQLVAVGKQLWPDGGTLSYTLEPPQALTDAATAEAYSSASSVAPLRHDLRIDLQNVHEDELLTLLQRYAREVKGSFRVEGCHLDNPGPTGLYASCTLRFFTLPEGKAS
ncbi:hypothetical protein B9N43_16865 [Denitratisoma sp. DHT3]|uniref:hypothetical protein n=1 Tax=Denitratisoma sp. DHT3 TaxID=1981880 RepID=UPI0011988172|nr:hypothetical protein [Denitratisoma sp. DHT3]QDX82757.1 hypothetical protein B9N43_16865 [Denitratisoma sp. DHT3]